MSRLVRRGGSRLGAALVAAVLASVAGAPAALAADPTFRAASATADFGRSIDITQQATLPAGVARVEAIVRAGPGARTFLATIPTPGTGAVTLRYTFETPPGALYPNTPVELGFRLTFDDGRVVDGPTTSVLYEDDRFSWKTLEGSVVRVHWYEGNNAFGQRALDIGERGVQDATALFGVEETTPIDFFIYADRDAFFDVIGSGLQENVGGLAVSDIRTLFANIAASTSFDPWVGVVVPHELTHVVFDTATKNPYREPLHWLNEGLADYLAQGFSGGMRSAVDRAGRDGTLLPLHALVAQFPTPSNLFSLAYDESVSAVDFMIRTYGREALVALVRSYANGISDDEAFTTALGVDTAAFEAAWLADIGFEAPVPFGPKPAPPGPLPPGWVAAPGQTAGPVATTRPSTPAQGTDVVGPVLLGIVIALVLVLAAGLLVSARRLSRGEALLPTVAPPVPEAAAPDPEPPAVEPERPATAEADADRTSRTEP